MGLHRYHMTISGPMARLASDSGSEMVHFKLPAFGRSGRVTTEASRYRFGSKRPPQGVPQRWRYGVVMQNGEVEITDLPVITEAAFVERPVIFQHVSLAQFALSETETDTC